MPTDQLWFIQHFDRHRDKFQSYKAYIQAMLKMRCVSSVIREVDVASFSGLRQRGAEMRYSTHERLQRMSMCGKLRSQ